jgi:CelD/BcsL family acetyltransferase involved in cellulose biosynthesis
MTPAQSIIIDSGARSAAEAPSTDSVFADSCVVDVMTDGVAFVAFEAEWNEAVERAGIAHPFLRHEWLRTWWECFGAGRSLHIMIVRRGDRIQAIAPLMLETTRMYGIPVRCLRFLENDHTPRADFIIVERRDESYRALWTALLARRNQWDVLQLSWLPPESPTADVMAAYAAGEGFPSGRWHGEDSPYLVLPASWETYAASLSSKFRQNLRNRLTRLTQIGEPALEVLDDPTAIQGACDDTVRLEASGWKRTEGTAIASDRAVHRFYTSLAERAGARGWIRLLFLTVGGKRIATSYAAQFGGRLFLCKTGYDPEYAKCAPFKMLTYFAVRDALATGLTEVDFLGGAEPWKLEWTATTRSLDWLFVFSRTWRARLLYFVKFQIAPALKRCRAGSRSSG